MRGGARGVVFQENQESFKYVAAFKNTRPGHRFTKSPLILKKMFSAMLGYKILKQCEENTHRRTADHRVLIFILCYVTCGHEPPGSLGCHGQYRWYVQVGREAKGGVGGGRKGGAEGGTKS